MINLKFTAVMVLYLFLPLTALTYYFSRRRRRIIEVERILTLLRADPTYRQVHEAETLRYYLWAVAYASAVACAGLALLFFSRELGLMDAEFPAITLGGAEFPQKGSRLVFGMAFFGVYLWGLQHVLRRYSSNDLSPGVYYNFSIRMVLSPMVALVIYNGSSALTGGADSTGGIATNIWPALAFLIGIFPERGFRWLSDRVPVLSPPGDSSVQPAPLEMIEGVEAHDVLRLAELSIDSCYDLATADFVPLVLKTAYSARQLIDWILQAKLCVYFGDSVRDLRRIGIRTVIDLESLSDEAIEALPAETSVTKYVLERARDTVRNSGEVRRLRQVGDLLGLFSERDDIGGLVQP
jgi:hypothetical protein